VAHTFGTASTRTSAATNPIAAAAFTVDDLDTVVVLFLKVNGGTDRTGGAPTFAGQTMTQASTTQKAASSPEASCELWYLLNPLQGSWVCSIPNAGELTVFYTLATGRAKAGGHSALDVVAGTNGTSTNPSAGAATTTQDGDIGFAVCCSGLTDFDPATPSHTGFGTGTGTPLGTFDDGAHGGGQQYALQASAGAITMGWTVGSDDWGCVAVFFKEVLPTVVQNRMRFKAGQGMSITENVF
jgi:hypothetical protein